MGYFINHMANGIVGRCSDAALWVDVLASATLQYSQYICINITAAHAIVPIVKILTNIKLYLLY